jgi:hypothetical protein
MVVSVVAVESGVTGVVTVLFDARHISISFVNPSKTSLSSLRMRSVQAKNSSLDLMTSFSDLASMYKTFSLMISLPFSRLLEICG